MANRGKIEVELRLLLDKLRSDVRAANAEIKRGMATSMAAGAGVAAPTAKAMDTVEAKVKKVTKAVKDNAKALDDWRKSLPAPVIRDFSGSQPSTLKGGPGPTIPMTPGPTTATPPSRLAQPPPVPPQRPRYTGPAPPVIPANPAVTLKTMFAGLVNSPLGKGMQALTGLVAGLAALRVAVGLIKYAFELALIPVKVFARLMHDAAEQARALYAHALSSGGQPLGYSVRRQVLANALGVSERELDHFGNVTAAVGYKFRVASKSLADTTPELAALAADLRSVKALTAAWAAELSSALSPALRELLSFGRMLGTVMVNSIKNAAGFIKLAARALMETLVESVLGKAGVMAYRGLAGSVNKDPLPRPDATPGRGAGLGFSQWQRMGLTVGAVPRAHWEMVTARNTGRLVDIADRIHSLMNPGQKAQGKNGHQQGP